MEESTEHESETLRAFLLSKGIWHRFIIFDEPVKTVEQAARQVDVAKIVKSIIMMDSEQRPLLVILPAKNKISHRKVKALLSVKDVRLAREAEVLAYSGYPPGGVPPFNKVKRAYADPGVLRNNTSIVGGGDVNKLVEIRTSDIMRLVEPNIADVSDERTSS